MKPIRISFSILVLLIVFTATQNSIAQLQVNADTQAPAKSLAVAASDAKNAKRSRNPNALTEGFVFYMQDFKYQHQSELNTLNIKFQYTYISGITTDQYPEFRLLLNDITSFLQNYPDEEAYWEILNKDVTAYILNRYPVVLSITSEIQVSPSPMITYLRATTVTRQQTGSPPRDDRP